MDTTELNKIKSVILDLAKAQSNEKTKEYGENVARGIDNVIPYIKDSEEKLAIAVSASTNTANQLAYTLFCDDKLTDELSAEVKSLRPVAEVSEAVKKFSDARDERVKELQDGMKEVTDARRDNQLFISMLSGLSEEEAKSRIDQYEKQVAEATK